jgi:dTMP kinase
MNDGRLITFEGGEGSGKSTQARLLADALRTFDRRIVLTREPGGSPFAEHLRNLILDPATPPHGALTETLLFYAARADHIAHTIRPALAQGRWVICDRYSDSTRVYQGLAGDVAPADLADLERIVVGTARPSLTIIMDIDPVAGMARVEARRQGGAAASRGRLRRAAVQDPYEARDLEFHRRLRAGFLEVAALEPDRCIVVDAERPEAEIAAAIFAAVRVRLLGGSP